VSASLHLRAEMDPVPETSFVVILENNDGQNSHPSDSERYTPSSEPFSASHPE
jgi:hypothetical protein